MMVFDQDIFPSDKYNLLRVTNAIMDHFPAWCGHSNQLTIYWSIHKKDNNQQIWVKQSNLRCWSVFRPGSICSNKSKTCRSKKLWLLHWLNVDEIKNLKLDEEIQVQKNKDNGTYHMSQVSFSAHRVIIIFTPPGRSFLHQTFPFMKYWREGVKDGSGNPISAPEFHL